MPPAVMTIAILDANRYFAQGLETLLHRHFTLLDVPVRFLPASDNDKATLLFYGNNTSCNTQFCRQHHGHIRQHVIIVKDSAGNRRHRYPPPCLNDLSELVVIDHHISPASLWQSIEQTLAQPPLLRQDCQRCCGRLTPRERQVLSALGKSLTLTTIALQMRLNLKTISAHKCNAMRKLGFTRNTELYSWLQNGGLHNICSPK